MLCFKDLRDAIVSQVSASLTCIPGSPVNTAPNASCSMGVAYLQHKLYIISVFFKLIGVHSPRLSS